MKDKTYEYEGVRLVKKPTNKLNCTGCFFKNALSCISIVEKKINSSCFINQDGNKSEMIFVEVEPVNKIE